MDSEAELIARRRERIKLLPPPPASPTVSAPTNNPIDQFLVADWAKSPAPSGAPEPALCDDATFCRRVYLDLIGVIPSLVEVNRFLADSSPEKRNKLIDALLARRGEYAAHWAPFWEDALGSQNVASQGGILTHGDYRKWILDSFEQGRSFDVMVAELLDPTMPRRKQVERPDVFGERYNVEYVRNEDHTATLQTAANVGQLFLGTSMKCASCHDHFDNAEWTQERFLGFAGLFAPYDLEKIRCDVRSGKTVPARWPFESADAVVKLPVNPAARLHQTAQQIVDPLNARFARTIVNRLWRRFLGAGLFEPVDDYRGDTVVSHPELLDWLTHDFITHDYQINHTVRLILRSRTYQLRYEPQLADTLDLGRRDVVRMFRSPGLRRLTAEQFIDSVRMATAEQLPPAERNFQDARSTGLPRALGKPASRNEIITARPDDVAVVQLLELMNGPELQALLDEAVVLHRAVRKADLPRLVDKMYRTALSRPPNADERRAGLTFLSANPNYAEGVKDLYWVLFCSPEFQYIR
ncbi:MAG: DUF1549 domain-containing protein [Planctomycetes bacterium]|nr:DUF1549 domain-containing protein [Planctomycetota bacterium]